MSGVIDKDGVQWERCNGCGIFVELGELRYELPTPEHPHGRDLCPACAKKSPKIYRETPLGR